MRGKTWFGRLLLFAWLALLTANVVKGQKQEAVPGGKSETLSPAAQPLRPQTEARPAHRFWDRKNGWLFTGVGASRTLDYFSTLNMRRRGVREIFLTNDVVDNHAEFAAIEAGGTAVSIGAAYLLHHSGHHRLERWTSRIHIGLATGGAIRNYLLKTPHSAPPLVP